MSQELVDEAVRLDEEGQSERALFIWKQLAAGDPTRSVLLGLGNCAKKLGLIDEAERAFKRVLEIDGRSEITLRSLGILALDRGDYDIAVEYLKRACAVEETAGALTVLGVALSRTRNDPDAETAYRKAIQINPNYEEAYYNLGVLLRQNGRVTEAPPLLRKAIELDPGYAAAHRELGFVLMRRGIDPETESHLRKAVELASDDAWARIYLGTYLWGTDAEAAEAEFRIAAKLQPTWAVPLTSLGSIYESKDLGLARSFFARALELEPENWSGLTGLARVYFKRGEPDLAKKYILQALQQHPRDPRSLALLSEIESE